MPVDLTKRSHATVDDWIRDGRIRLLLAWLALSAVSCSTAMAVPDASAVSEVLDGGLPLSDVPTAADDAEGDATGTSDIAPSPDAGPTTDAPPAPDVWLPPDTSTTADAGADVAGDVSDSSGCNPAIPVWTESFETSGPTILAPTTIGTLTWRGSAHRAFSGVYSLAFQNDCFTLHPTVTKATGCVPGGDADAVVGKLNMPLSPMSGATGPWQLRFQVWPGLWPTQDQPVSEPCSPTATCACQIGSFCMPLASVPCACMLPSNTLYLRVDGVLVWSSADFYQVPGNTWTEQVVQLPGTQPPTTLQWMVKSNGQAANLLEGPYIDDVSLSSVCPQP